MNSILLRSAARLLLPILVVLSLVVLYRGHNLPGGGFIGGLLAAAGFALISLGEGAAAGRRALRISPVALMATGLLVALGSGCFALLAGEPLLTGMWLPTFSLPLLGTVHLGTPLLFDVGVYLTVIGFVLAAVFTVSEPEEER